MDALFCWIRSMIRSRKIEELCPNVEWWTVQKAAKGIVLLSGFRNLRVPPHLFEAVIGDN